MSSAAATTPPEETPTLLVTAGPSREYFDDVRFLSNASSGRMGVAVANAAAERGWCVHLALGEGSTAAGTIDARVRVHPFVSARDLSAICAELWPEVNAFVATAAVCDYRPGDRVSGKRKKTPGDWEMTLVPNPDVLAELSLEKGNRLLVGFALEASRDRDEARRKLEEKHLDVILLNTTSNLGSDSGDYLWMPRDGEEQPFDDISKQELGVRIADYVESSWMSSS